MTADTTTGRPAIDLLDGRTYADDLHGKLTWLRHHEPVYLDPNNVWGITKHADIRAMSTNPATYSNAGGCRPEYGPSPMMVDMDDPAHLRRRSLVNSGFTPRRVRDLEQRIRHICDYVIDGICEKGEADFVADLACLLPIIVIGDMLGAPAEDRAMLLRWSDAMMTPPYGDDIQGLHAKMVEASDGYRAYCARAIAERRASGSQSDLLGVLVHAEIDGDRLTDAELIMESLLLLNGGDETTRHVITGGWEELIQNPDQLERLRRDPGLLDTAVDEMLRWVTPIKSMARTLTRDVEFRGKELKQGQKVMLMYPSANRDEDVFADPFTFDVGRRPNNHLAFGVGSHFCLGSNLARLEIKIMTERVLARLPDLELVGDRPLRPSNFVSGIETMPVRFTPTPSLGTDPV